MNRPSPRYRPKVQTLAVSEDRQIVELPPGAEIVLLEPIGTSEKKRASDRVVGRPETQDFALDLCDRGERADSAAE